MNDQSLRRGKAKQLHVHIYGARILTFEWRLNLSTADRTQPMLPSPPNTMILNFSNLWNSCKLELERKEGRDGGGGGGRGGEGVYRGKGKR